ncbi:hypothetical protein CHARACLAT_010286, partial [Characodon lateralis]|nr:hypothetical protein [Characodon lateralis]
MACNIYEDPDLTMKVSYNKGARRKGWEREEKVVDIYESADTLTGPRLNPSRKGRGARTQKRPPAVQRNSYKAAALILGLLCLLLLAGISVLLILYLPISLKSKQPNLSCQIQTKEKQNQSDT